MEMNLNQDKGQHLLIDKKIVEREIKEANISKKDKIIEIGAGNGILTQELAKLSHVLAFEIDKKFEKELEKINSKNLKIIYDSALNHSWKGYNKIVSNIPYFLSGDIIIKSAREDIEMLVLVVGEDFKKKLENKEGKIGVFADVFFDFMPIMQIDKSSFSPAPKVNSWMIKLERKNKADKIEDLLKRILVKKGKVKNAIIHSFLEIKKTKNESREIIKKMKIPEETLNKPMEKITGEFIIKLRENLKTFISS